MNLSIKQNSEKVNINTVDNVLSLEDDKLKLEVRKKCIELEDGCVIKVIKQGERFEDVVFTAVKSGNNIKRLSKDKFVVMSTGEVKEYKHSKTKSMKSLRQTFARLKAMIRTNFEADANNQLFITLTYAENMTDTKKLYKDFEKFYKRLCYKFKNKNYGLEYISVCEPQERGAWHIHLMLKSTKQNYLYINNKEIEKLWGLGYTKTERLKSDDVGTYYVAYFTNIVENEKNDIDKSKTKMQKKGSRLHLYPLNFKFYRYSRGG